MAKKTFDSVPVDIPRGKWESIKTLATGWAVENGTSRSYRCLRYDKRGE